MERIAILDLGGGKKYPYASLDDAKAAWLQILPRNHSAIIDVYPPVGTAGVLISYRFDVEGMGWAQVR
ncbi:hypothetical protein ATO1_08660 [Phaeobacter sp. 22II1-1F12B]|nr:hypothetical protein ATO1_08660 [Phaeobacter sp. 22II1-1F12B]